MDQKGHVHSIVEQKDLDEQQQQVHACNASVYCFDIEAILWALPRIENHNAAGEYYLTDAIGLLAQAGYRVAGVVAQDHDECRGINTRVQLLEATEVMRSRIQRMHMLNGVTLIDAQTTYIDTDVTIGRDTVIYPNCTLQKGTAIGARCTLLPNCRISASDIGDEVQIESSVILESRVKDRATVGPFAYLRPGTVVGEACRIGDFVELKNSTIGRKTKISHLTYVGDSDLGEEINVGCGVVFVNYDGKKKFRSRVGDHAFIGCNANLVAPVEIGAHAYIAAGSTITEDVPEQALSVARARQVNKAGWVEKRREAGKI
ncbi:MAG: bifunctional UDP-N-acetylglucosamine diphosphorylase/glucosamine-1-phosphate N-acetyltransferase GlmU, partial [Clostridia bacterium]